MTFGLNDICLVPARISRIEHRGECNPCNDEGMLPLFTAPMNSVLNQHNYTLFRDQKINTIIPRGVAYDIRYSMCEQTFVAFGLEEFRRFIADFEAEGGNKTRKACVDIANGHMKKLIDLCTEAKNKFGNRLTLMAGNIANPDTYLDYAMAGIDYVRVGIGGGSACTTSANGGVHYAMASLIVEVAKRRSKVREELLKAEHGSKTSVYRTVPALVADGGFNNYDKIIKALALGADYVMIGKLFAQCEEACAEIDKDGNRIYYGMSTKRAQKETGNSRLKTAEGIVVQIPVLYTLHGWTENFVDYLRSMMSYTDSFTLEDFQHAEHIIVSPSEYLAYYK